MQKRFGSVDISTLEYRCLYRSRILNIELLVRVQPGKRNLRSFRERSGFPMNLKKRDCKSSDNWKRSAGQDGRYGQKKDSSLEIYDIFHRFMAFTSIGGLTQIHATQSWISRLFWAVLFLVGIVLTTWNVYQIFKTYSQRKVILSS